MALLTGDSLVYKGPSLSSKTHTNTDSRSCRAVRRHYHILPSLCVRRCRCRCRCRGSCSCICGRNAQILVCQRFPGSSPSLSPCPYPYPCPCPSSHSRISASASGTYANGGWQMVDGEWQMVDGKCQVGQIVFTHEPYLHLINIRALRIQQ